MRVRPWIMFAIGGAAGAATLAIWRALRSPRKSTPNDQEPSDPARSRVLDYGNALYRYSGVGILQYPTEPPRQVEFDAGQLQSGEVLVVCTCEDFSAQHFFPIEHEDPTSFEGTTQEGWKIRSVDAIRQTNYLPRTRQPGSYDAFRLRGISVLLSDQQDQRATHYRFGLVNFNVTGIRPVTVHRKGGEWYILGLPVELKCGDQTVFAVIVQIEDGDEKYRRVMTLKSYDVLSELICDCPTDADPSVLEAAISDLCIVLSVMRGTRVQWVYRERWVQDAPVEVIHRSRLTRPYSPLSPIGSSYEHREDTARFITAAMGRLPTIREPYITRGIVDAYLDAKAERDFLQTRGAKIAVAIEKLKHAFLAASDSHVSEFILDPNRWADLVPQVRAAVTDALRSAAVDRNDVGMLSSAGKIRGLNRVAFAGVLKGLCQHVGLAPKPGEIDLFVASRNKLVHAGEFYCDAATDDERKRVPPPIDATTEFFFLVSFLDRIFLKLFGYSGPFTDRQKPDGSLISQLD